MYQITYVSENNDFPQIESGLWFLSTKQEHILTPHSTQLVPTGFRVCIQKGIELLACSLPSLVLSEGVFLLNAPGTIDSDYRGELCGIVTNISKNTYRLEKGSIFALVKIGEITVMERDSVKSSTDTDTTVIFHIRKTGIPQYQTEGSSGMDVQAAIEEPITIEPKSWQIIDTGIKAVLPKSVHLEIRSRSGLALKHSIIVMGAPLIIWGEQTIHVPLYNLGTEPFTVEPNMRIAQAICIRTCDAMYTAASELGDSSRGHSGFGSTGL